MLRWGLSVDRFGLWPTAALGAKQPFAVARSFEGQEDRVDGSLSTMLADLQGDGKTAVVSPRA
jgi:hypothetical protein